MTGWSALDPPAGPPSPEVAELAGQMRGWPAAFLLLGHLTAYKDAPAVITEFLASTRRARLAVAGDCADPGTARQLQRTASASAGRFILRLRKVPPEQAGHLYAAAHAAVCPYRSDGPFSFFTDVLYPGSVGTAAGFGVPVIAPALPAVAEITGGQPRWLASPGGGLGAAMAAAEADLLALTASADLRSTRPGPRSPDLWHRITSTYCQVSASLAARPRPAGDSRPVKEMTVMPQTSSAPDSSLIAAVLADRYGLAPQRLTQLPIGQGTVNYRAACAGRDVFVKSYPPGTGLPGERAAIDLTALARKHGVPVAPLIKARDGQLIDTSTSTAVSVWDWMPGTVNTGELTSGQLGQAGHALGRIHAAFAPLPASAGPTPQVTAWRNPDLPGLDATITRLLAIIADRTAAGQAVQFDEQAARTLAQRRGMLGRIPALLDGLPALTAQVLHGDYSPVNLLFDGDALTAVTDFRPPDPFLIAYDLGRMAFYPNTVTSSPHWPGAARTLIAAYLRPALPPPPTTYAAAPESRCCNCSPACTASSSTTSSPAFSRTTSTTSGSCGTAPPASCSTTWQKQTPSSTTWPPGCPPAPRPAGDRHAPPGTTPQQQPSRARPVRVAGDPGTAAAQRTARSADTDRGGARPAGAPARPAVPRPR